MITKLVFLLTNLFSNMGASPYYASMFGEGLSFILLLAVGILLLYLARFIIKKTVYRVIVKSESKYDDQIINNKVLMRLCLLIPAVLIMKFNSVALPSFPNVQHFTLNCSIIYAIIAITMVLFSLVNAGSDIYNMHQTAKIKPLTGLVQTIKITLIIFCVLLIISYLMGKRVSSVIIGLGTLSAVLMLVFQNVILGFVGSIKCRFKVLVVNVLRKRQYRHYQQNKYCSDSFHFLTIPLQQSPPLQWSPTNSPTGEG